MTDYDDYSQYILDGKKLIASIEDDLRKHKIYDAHSKCSELAAKVAAIKNWSFAHLKEDKSCW